MFASIFVKQLGSIVLSVGFIWGFLAALVMILLIHHHYKFKISLAIPN